MCATRSPSLRSRCSWILAVTLVLAASSSGWGQIGGNHVFSYLSLPSSSRVSGLGGKLISAPEGDISLGYENPALIHADMDQQLSFQHQFLLAGIQTGYAGFGKWLESKKIMAHAGFKYILFGTFDQTDAFGNVLGEFKGSEVALVLGASYQVYDKLRIGANLKLANSSLDVYRSSAIAIDVGAIYTDTAAAFTAGLMIKNGGAQISTYESTREDLPLDVQLGLTKRLRYLPFQFSIIFHHLNQWNLLYDDPNNEEGGFLGGFQPVTSEPSDVDNFFRHVVFSGEMFLGKAEVVRIRLGYDHQRKQELSVSNLRTLTGFSIGIGFKVKKFNLDYSLSKVHFGGSTHHLGLSTNIKSFTRPGILN